MAKIIAMVFFDRGSQGFEEEFNENMSIENYIMDFEGRTKSMSGSRNAVLFYLEKTINEPDGSFKRDQKGERITERLYLNEKVSKAFFGY